jgi:hypothetical protein
VGRGSESTGGRPAARYPGRTVAEARAGGGGERVQQWAIPYLQQRFRITEPTKPELPDNCVYCWVGRQEEGSHVWWYFEIKPDDKSRPQWIDQRVFLERQENYTNRVLSLDHLPRRMLTLTSERPRANWDEATDSSATLNDSPRNESTPDR